MKKINKNTLFCLITLLIFCLLINVSKVNAEQKVAIVPFKVFGPYEVQYLKEALPEMFFSRLNISNKEVVNKDTLKALLKDVDIKDELKQAQYFLSKTDFSCLMLGAYTKMGDAFSLDIKILKKDEKEFKGFFVTKDKESKIFEAVSELSDKVAAYILGAKTVEIVPLTPTSIHETKGFKREKVFDVKQPLYGISVADFDGNGTKKLAVAGYSSVYIYDINGDKLNLLQNIELKGHEILTINSGDFNKNGKNEIYVTAINLDDAFTFIYEADNSGKFQLLTKTDWYVKVINHPEFGETLIGQRMGMNEPFTGDVYQLDLKTSGVFAKSVIPTLREFNMYQFTPIRYKNANAFAYFGEGDFLKIADIKGKVIERLKEPYDGSIMGVVKGYDEMTRERKFTGLNSRIIRLGNGETDTLLTLKNYGSRLFSRSKKFDRGVVAVLAYDGVNYKEVFSTEMIDGYVSDFALDLPNSRVFVSLVTDSKEGRIFIFKLQR